MSSIQATHFLKSRAPLIAGKAPGQTSARTRPLPPLSQLPQGSTASLKGRVKRYQGALSTVNKAQKIKGVNVGNPRLRTTPSVLQAAAKHYPFISKEELKCFRRFDLNRLVEFIDANKGMKDQVTLSDTRQPIEVNVFIIAWFKTLYSISPNNICTTQKVWKKLVSTMFSANLLKQRATCLAICQHAPALDPCKKLSFLHAARNFIEAHIETTEELLEFNALLDDLEVNKKDFQQDLEEAKIKVFINGLLKDANRDEFCEFLKQPYTLKEWLFSPFCKSHHLVTFREVVPEVEREAQFALSSSWLTKVQRKESFPPDLLNALIEACPPGQRRELLLSEDENLLWKFREESEEFLITYLSHCALLLSPEELFTKLYLPVLEDQRLVREQRVLLIKIAPSNLLPFLLGHMEL